VRGDKEQTADGECYVRSVSGGYENEASGYQATGGGGANTAESVGPTISGGVGITQQLDPGLGLAGRRHRWICVTAAGRRRGTACIPPPWPWRA